MKFKASKEQLQQIIANVVNASKPMGMGFFHYKLDKIYKPQDFCVDGKEIYIDYFEGRCVKLMIKNNLSSYEIPNTNINKEYQSWGNIYPTYKYLIELVGGEIIE